MSRHRNSDLHTCVHARQLALNDPTGRETADRLNVLIGSFSDTSSDDTQSGSSRASICDLASTGTDASDYSFLEGLYSSENLRGQKSDAIQQHRAEKGFHYRGTQRPQHRPQHRPKQLLLQRHRHSHHMDSCGSIRSRNSTAVSDSSDVDFDSAAAGDSSDSKESEEAQQGEDDGSSQSSTAYMEWIDEMDTDVSATATGTPAPLQAKKPETLTHHTEDAKESGECGAATDLHEAYLKITMNQSGEGGYHAIGGFDDPHAGGREDAVIDRARMFNSDRFLCSNNVYLQLPRRNGSATHKDKGNKDIKPQQWKVKRSSSRQQQRGLSGEDYDVDMDVLSDDTHEDDTVKGDEELVLMASIHELNLEGGHEVSASDAQPRAVRWTSGLVLGPSRDEDCGTSSTPTPDFLSAVNSSKIHRYNSFTNSNSSGMQDTDQGGGGFCIVDSSHLAGQLPVQQQQRQRRASFTSLQPPSKNVNGQLAYHHLLMNQQQQQQQQFVAGGGGGTPQYPLPQYATAPFFAGVPPSFPLLGLPVQQQQKSGNLRYNMNSNSYPYMGSLQQGSARRPAAASVDGTSHFLQREPLSAPHSPMFRRDHTGSNNSLPFSGGALPSRGTPNQSIRQLSRGAQENSVSGGDATPATNAVPLSPGMSTGVTTPLPRPLQQQQQPQRFISATAAAAAGFFGLQYVMTDPPLTAHLLSRGSGGRSSSASSSSSSSNSQSSIDSATVGISGDGDFSPDIYSPWARFRPRRRVGRATVSSDSESNLSTSSLRASTRRRTVVGFKPSIEEPVTTSGSAADGGAGIQVEMNSYVLFRNPTLRERGRELARSLDETEKALKERQDHVQAVAVVDEDAVASPFVVVSGSAVRVYTEVDSEEEPQEARGGQGEMKAASGRAGTVKKLTTTLEALHRRDTEGNNEDDGVTGASSHLKRENLPSFLSGPPMRDSLSASIAEGSVLPKVCSGTSTGAAMARGGVESCGADVASAAKVNEKQGENDDADDDDESSSSSCPEFDRFKYIFQMDEAISRSSGSQQCSSVALRLLKEDWVIAGRNVALFLGNTRGRNGASLSAAKRFLADALATARQRCPGLSADGRAANEQAEGQGKEVEGDGCWTEVSLVMGAAGADVGSTSDAEDGEEGKDGGAGAEGGSIVRDLLSGISTRGVGNGSGGNDSDGDTELTSISIGRRGGEGSSCSWLDGVQLAWSPLYGRCVRGLTRVTVPLQDGRYIERCLTRGFLRRATSGASSASASRSGSFSSSALSNGSSSATPLSFAQIFLKQTRSSACTANAPGSKGDVIMSLLLIVFLTSDHKRFSRLLTTTLSPLDRNASSSARNNINSTDRRRDGIEDDEVNAEASGGVSAIPFGRGNDLLFRPERHWANSDEFLAGLTRSALTGGTRTVVCACLSDYSTHTVSWLRVLARARQLEKQPAEEIQVVGRLSGSVRTLATFLQSRRQLIEARVRAEKKAAKEATADNEVDNEDRQHSLEHWNGLLSFVKDIVAGLRLFLHHPDRSEEPALLHLDVEDMENTEVA